MELTSALRNALQKEGFVDTGDLLNSIEFRIYTNPVKIELGANDYIQYLDDGRFIERFFNSSEVVGIVDRITFDLISSKLG